MSKGDLVPQLDSLFTHLDAAKPAPSSIIKSDAHREHYESLVMFAFRKLQAACYHQQRVHELIALRLGKLHEHKIDDLPEKLKLAAATLKLSESAAEFSFELCAFFAAIRSAIDFIARVCGEHSKSIQVESITTFVKLIEKGRSGPILSVIKNHSKWLGEVRDYRDYLVHRLCISTTSGGHIEAKDGISNTVPYPVVVPASTPKHVPDTRRARQLDEPEMHFMTLTSEKVFTDIDGNKRLLERKIEIEPAPGYIRIEHLMAREIAALEGFFSDILKILVVLDFQPAPIETAP